MEMNGDGYQYKKGATGNISPLICLMGRKGKSSLRNWEDCKIDISLLVLTIFMVDDSRYSAITGWILGFSTGTLGLIFCWAWNKLRISLFN
jgi:hypothetical protein